MRARVGRSGARRRQQGAALVEALVVIPFFLIVFACLLFIASLYKEKLRVMRLTKEAAWSYAMANCGEPGDPHTSYVQQPSADGPSAQRSSDGKAEVEGMELSDAQKAGGDEATLASRDFGSSTASAQSSVGAAALIGGYTKTVSSETRVMCNEAPYDGDLQGFVHEAWQAVTKW